MINKILNVLDKIIEVTGKVSSLLIIVLIALISISVFLRYVFSVGFVWLQDLYIWIHSLFILLGIGYTLKKDEHVRIDILYRSLSKKKKRNINILGYLLFCIPFTFCLTSSGFDYFLRSYLLSENSKETGGLPNIYILKFFIFFLGIIFILEIFRFLITVFNKNGNS